MKSSEITKLNQNLEALNSNIEKLLSVMGASAVHGVMVASPVVAEVSNVVSLSKSLMSRGLELSSDERGVSTVNLVNLAKAKECESECFERVQYNPHTKELTVFFRGNRLRKGYTYSGVSGKFYNEFMMAPSLGRFYTRHIKGNYSLIK